MIMDSLSNIACILFFATFSVRSSTVDASNYDNFTITPKDPYMENGTTLRLYCRLDSVSRTASDLRWFVYIGSSIEYLPESSIRIVNNSMSELHLVPPLGDTTFYCTSQDDLTNYDASVVHVGYKPEKVRNLACHCRNIKSFWCEWEVVQDRHRLYTESFFRYKSQHGPLSGSWQDCQELRREDGESLHTCMISSDNDPDYNPYGYIVEVTASNPLGNVTTMLRFHPTLQARPYAPQNLDGEALDGYRLNITWDVPAQWPDHYQLTCEVGYWKKVSPVEPEPEKTTIYVDDCTQITEGLIEDLHPFTTYEISIRAQYIFSAMQQWSEWSDELELLTLTEVPSGSVSNLEKLFTSVVPDDPSLRKVILAWDEVPEEQCNGVILGYNVYVTKDEEPRGDSPTYNVSASSGVIEIIVDQFDTFRVYVVAFNSAGEGMPAFPVDIFDMTRIPGKPVNVETTALSATSILVEWSAPVELHGRILYYMVDRKKTTENEEWITEEVDGSEHLFTITGLDPYTYYEFRVQANNSAGLGAWSESSQVMTHEADPSSFPRDIKLVTLTDRPTELLLTWRPPYRSHSRGKILAYNIYYCEKRFAEFNTHNASDEVECDDPDFVNFTKVDDQETQESFYRFTLTSLNAYTKYLLWMTASNSAGEGIISHRMSATTDEGIPEKPDVPVLDEVYAFAVELHWEAPDKPNGNISRYIVNYNSSETMMMEKEIEGTSALITDEVYGSERYAFRVSACNDQLCSDFSEPLFVTTLVGTPEPVSVFEVNLIATDKVELSWLEPVHPNGVISHYIVSYRPENVTDSRWKNRTVRGSSTTIQVDCVEGASFFTYVITAVTTDGTKELIGEPIEKKFEMCKKLPIPVIIMAVLIPGLVLMMAVACFYIIKVKKIELFKPFPEPRFIEDFIKPWDAPLKPEKEHFDQLKTYNDRYTAPPNKIQERTVSKTSSGMDSDQGFDETEVMVELPGIHDKNTKAGLRSSSSSQGIGRSIVSDQHRENAVEYLEGDDAVFDSPNEQTCFDNEYYPMVNNPHLLPKSDVRKSPIEEIVVPDGDLALLERQESLGSHDSVEYHTMSNDGLIPIGTTKDDSSDSIHSLPSSQTFALICKTNEYQCIGKKDFLPPILNTSTSVDNSSTTSDYPASPDSYEYGMLGHINSTSPLSPVSVSIPRDATTDHCNNVQQALLLAPLNQRNNNKDFAKTNNLRIEPDISGDYVCNPRSQSNHDELNDNVDPYTVIPVGGGSPPQSNSMPYSQLSVRPAEVREGNLSDGVTKCNYSRIPDGPLTPPPNVPPPKSLDSYLAETPQTSKVDDRTDKTGKGPVFEVPDSGIDSDHSNNSLGLEVVPVETQQEFNTEDGNLVSLPMALAGNTVVQRPQTQMDIEPLIIDDLFAPTCKLEEDEVVSKVPSLIKSQDSMNVPCPLRSEGEYVVNPVL